MRGRSSQLILLLAAFVLLVAAVVVLAEEARTTHQIEVNHERTEQIGIESEEGRGMSSRHGRNRTTGRHHRWIKKKARNHIHVKNHNTLNDNTDIGVNDEEAYKDKLEASMKRGERDRESRRKRETQLTESLDRLRISEASKKLLNEEKNKDSEEDSQKSIRRDFGEKDRKMALEREKEEKDKKDAYTEREERNKKSSEGSFKRAAAYEAKRNKINAEKNAREQAEKSAVEEKTKSEQHEKKYNTPKAGECFAYEHAEYQGKKWVVRSDMRDLSSEEGMANAISSIRCGPGTRAMLFERPRFAGRKLIVEGYKDYSYFQQNNFNDRTNSIKMLPQGMSDRRVTLDKGTDRGGNDYNMQMGVGSAESCRSICEDDERCKAFAWHWFLGRCWKKRSEGRKTNQWDVTSGKKIW